MASFLYLPCRRLRYPYLITGTLYAALVAWTCKLARIAGAAELLGIVVVNATRQTGATIVLTVCGSET